MNTLSLAILLSVIPALAAANTAVNVVNTNTVNGVSSDRSVQDAINPLTKTLNSIQNGDKVSGSSLGGLGLTASGDLTKKGDVTLTGSFGQTTQSGSIFKPTYNYTLTTFTIHLTLDDNGNVVGMTAEEQVQSGSDSNAGEAQAAATRSAGTVTKWSTDSSKKSAAGSARGEKPKSTIPSEEKPSFVGQTNPKQQQAVACGGTVSPSSPDCD